MAIKKSLKKGGVARYVIQGANNNDFFTLPRGFHLTYLGVETLGAQLPSAATISLGKVPGTYTTATFTVTGPFTSSSNAATWGGGAAGTITATAAVVTAATAATSAAYFATQSPVQTVVGLAGTWIVTASGAVVTMISSVPGNFTAPTLTVGSSGLTIGAIVTVLGAVDATYMAATPLATAAIGSITEFTSSITRANLVNPSTIGSSLSAIFTSAAGAAGSYSVAGQTVAIPNGLTAIATGYAVAGCSFYEYTIATSGTGTYFINGVSITGSATPATLATNIAASYIPGWIIIASSAKVTCYSVYSGVVGQPTLTLGTATTLTTSGVTWLPGYVNPGYVTQSTQPVTNTITVTGTSASTGKVAVNGVTVTIPNTALVAQSAAIIAGAAIWRAQIATSAAGINAINGITYTSSATPGTTATNLAALAIPGWLGYVATDVITLIATTPGVLMPEPVFSTTAGVALPTFASKVYSPGFILPGYTQSFTPTTAVLVGPAPSFKVLVAPTTQTYGFVYTFGGSTGLATISVDQQNNPGAQAPTLTGSLTTQTYTQTSLAGDLPYYVNFSDEPGGRVNVYALMEKLN
jgi:hypothetical protein